MAQSAAGCRVTTGPEASGPDGTDYQCVVGDYVGEIPGETGSHCTLSISAQGDILYSDGNRTLSLPHNTWSGSTLFNDPSRRPPIFNWSAVTPSGFLMIARNPEGLYGVTASPYSSPGVVDAANAPKPCYLQ